MKTFEKWEYKSQEIFSLLEKGKLYNQLFEARQEGDYVDFVSFDHNLVEPWIPKVKGFIDDIKHLCDN